jgi:hypothetical protein
VAAATAGGLSKFFDVNLTQLLTGTPVRDTIEVRILPGAIDADDIMNRAGLVELLLDRCLDREPVPRPPADQAAAVETLLDARRAYSPGGRRLRSDPAARRPVRTPHPAASV